jgi:hypothetical protein
MADGFKILAQATLSDTEATIYAVPAAGGSRFASRQTSQTIVSSIILCCTTGAPATYSIRVKNSISDANNDKQFIFKLQPISAPETDVLSLGIGLVAGNCIEAQCSTDDVVQMSIFGTEVT